MRGLSGPKIYCNAVAGTTQGLGRSPISGRTGRKKRMLARSREFKLATPLIDGGIVARRHNEWGRFALAPGLSPGDLMCVPFEMKNSPQLILP